MWGTVLGVRVSRAVIVGRNVGLRSVWVEAVACEVDLHGPRCVDAAGSGDWALLCAERIAGDVVG